MRIRSNSLSENSPEKANRLKHKTGGDANMQIPLQSLSQDQDKKDKMMAFHSELSETCIDILSTYAYANLSAKPKRIATAEFLLKNGQTASWVIGTKIVTVTTSTCDQTPSRGQLCDRCYLVCSRHKPDEGRHKSSEGISGQSGLANSIQDADESSRRYVACLHQGHIFFGQLLQLSLQKYSLSKYLVKLYMNLFEFL